MRFLVILAAIGMCVGTWSVAASAQSTSATRYKLGVKATKVPDDSQSKIGENQSYNVQVHKIGSRLTKAPAENGNQPVPQQ